MLLPVKVAVPLSECSSAVRTQGQLSGATVRVTAQGSVVAEGVATTADALIPLLPGVELQGGSPVVATQSFEGETSDPSPVAVVVGFSPPSLSPVTVGVAHRCSQCLYVAGAVPGASVQVIATAGPLAGVRGQGDVWLTRQVIIDPPVAQDEQLWVHQQACGQTGPDIGVKAEFEPPFPLPAPALDPLKECERSIRMTGVVPGAVVEVERSAGSDIVGCVSAAAGFFVVPALQAGEVLRVRQRFETCELVSDFSPRYEVEPVDPVPRPMIAGKYDSCAGTKELLLTELRPTAQVRVLVDGESIGVAEVPPDAVSFLFPVPPLATGAIVTAQQGLCGVWSAPSNSVTISDEPWEQPHPEIPGPLYPCAVAVRVAGITLGWHTVTVRSHKAYGVLTPIGQTSTFVQGGEVDVPVQSLLPGDVIDAELNACGGPLPSAPVDVHEQMPAVGPPDIPEPLIEGWSAVPIHSVIPGAWVDVWVNDVWRGAAGVGGVSGWVPITGNLEVGDVLQARQTMCARVSPRGRRTQVVHKLPVPHFIAVPNEGEAPLDVAFDNQTVGASHPTEPYHWDFDATANGPSATSSDEHPQHTYTKPGAYTVSLRAKNASGWEATISRPVTVLQPPSPGETSVTLKLTATPGGGTVVPFKGEFPPPPNTVLTKIWNPSYHWTLGFPKEKDGKTIQDCGKGDADAIVLLGPNQELTGAKLADVWGQAAPPTPHKYECCGPPDVGWLTIVVTYADKP